MSGCCGANSPGLSVSRCLDEGLAARRLPPLRVAGPSVPGLGGLKASFSLAPAGDTVTDVRFRCTSCATLIACCQALAVLVRGRSVEEAAALDAGALFSRLPGIPPTHSDRAVLAAAALRAVLNEIRRTSHEEGPR